MAARSFEWVDGGGTDEELTRINVFDASGAVVQVEKSNQLAYIPEILKVFQDLAEACKAVGARLKAEKDALCEAYSREIERAVLRPGTRSGILIGSSQPKRSSTISTHSVT